VLNTAVTLKAGFIAQPKILSPGTSYTPTLPPNFPQLAKYFSLLATPIFFAAVQVDNSCTNHNAQHRPLVQRLIHMLGGTHTAST